MRGDAILYMSGTLPTLSETFVTSEVFGLRRMGFDVLTASVHEPQGGLGTDDLERLAEETIRIYPENPLGLVVTSVVGAVSTPVRSARVFSRAVRDALGAKGVPLSRRGKIVWQALASITLARKVRPLGVAHIHAHMAHVPTTIAMYASMHLGITFSFTGHAVDIFKERTLLEEKLRRGAFVACISRWHRDFYRELVPIDDARAPVIRCGVPIPQPRKEPVLPGETVSILGVGRMVPKKGFDTLVRALAVLAGEGRAFECTLIGDGTERASLETLAGELGIAERVSFLGARPNAEIRERMLKDDLFVLPCRTASTGDRDGIPVVLMEAMASGMVAVSGDLPAIRELIGNGQTGVTVSGDDEAALARALAGLLDDPSQARQIAESGREHVKNEFSDEMNLERLSSSIRQWTGVRPTSGQSDASDGESDSP